MGVFFGYREGKGCNACKAVGGKQCVEHVPRKVGSGKKAEEGKSENGGEKRRFFLQKGSKKEKGAF